MTSTTTTSKVRGIDAAVQILKQAGGGPLSMKEVCAQAVPLATGMKGKTPAATISAQVYLAAKRGETFVIPTRGQVALLGNAEPKPPVELTNGEAEENPPVEETSSPIEGAIVVKRGKKNPNEVKPDPKPAPKKPSRPKRSAKVAS